MAILISSETAATDPVPLKKGGRGRKALKNITTNEANISAGKQPPSLSSAHKDSGGGLSLPLSPTKTKPMSKVKAGAGKKSSAAELEELMGRFEKLRIEKEKTEKLLIEREDLLKKREEEIAEKGREQEMLQKEVKKLQKLKEFKPTMIIPVVQSLREKEQSKVSKKKNKDCSEIKKPSPAYILYCKDQWNEIKKENPELGFKDISNIVGAKWKNLTAEKKKPYEEKYQQEKEAYLQVVGKERREKEAMKLLEEEQLQKTAMDLLEQYLQFKQEADKKENNKPKKERDPLKPKQSMSAFFHFSSERRVALLKENHKSIVEIAKIAGEEWKNMNEEKRVPYEEAAKKQKEEYLQQMEIYKNKKAEEALSLQKEEDEQKKIQKQEALQLLKKKEKTENIIKKTKEDQQKKRKQKKEENSDPNNPKRSEITNESFFFHFYPLN